MLLITLLPNLAEMLMPRRFLGPLAVVASLGFAAPAVAQDWLGTHLDTQREENMRRHQQEQARTSNKPATRERYDPPISGKARHAAMRRHHREYARVMKARGADAADQWLADQVAAGR